jgi:hypothetical protein
MMTKQNTITWILLMLLTLIAGLASNTSISYLGPIILLLAALKFIGVAFNFMEIKKAHLFWQILIIGFLAIFCSITLLIL